jgi:ribonuclease PH
MRKDGRQENELRPITMIPNFTETKGGSVLINWGNTRVLCTALLEEGTMPFLKGTGKGWLTAEYAMLPSSTGNRKKRDYLKQDGRSTEIQRLIGRSLRSAVDLMALGERTITVDCDVLQGDGGTRTASVTGGFIAAVLAMRRLLDQGLIEKMPVTTYVAGVSAGIVDGVPLLDLCYREDSHAIVDMNCVMTEHGGIIELQATGEGRPYTAAEQQALLRLCEKGIGELCALEKGIVAL